MFGKKDKLAELEARIQAVEEWIEAFQQRCDEATRDIEEILGELDIDLADDEDVTVQFFPDMDAFRDKKKDH